MYVKAGTTSQSLVLYLQDAVTGGAYTTEDQANFTFNYVREGAASATADATITAGTLGTWGEGTAKPFGTTGLWQIDFANAAFAVDVDYVTLLVTHDTGLFLPKAVTVELSTRAADVTKISSSATAADNLEAVLLGTGHTADVDLTARSLAVTNDAGVGVAITGTTIGLDINATGGVGVDIDGTTSGVTADGAAGPGLHAGGTTFGIEAAASAGPALSAVSTGGHGIVAGSSSDTKDGINAYGNTTGDGIHLVAGATGHGISTQGGATSGHGIFAAGVDGNGCGLLCRGDQTANATGSGIKVEASVEGIGLDINGGTTSGAGVAIDSTSGAAVDITAASGIGVDIDGSTSGITTDGAAGAGLHAGGTTFGVEATASAGPGLSAVASAGTGAGIVAAGYGSGEGIKATGGATGEGLEVIGGATSGSGAKIWANGTNDIGLEIAGLGSGAGIQSTGGATGNGVTIVGGGTSGRGVDITTTNGIALYAVASGANDGVYFRSDESNGLTCIGNTDSASAKAGIYATGASGMRLYGIGTGTTACAALYLEYDGTTGNTNLADLTSETIAAILADTNELQTDWADDGRLDLLLDEAVADADRGNILETTTIAVLTSQTVFTLTAGSANNDAYNNCQIVIEDATTAAQKAVGYISDYTGSSKTVTLQADPGIFDYKAADKVTILAMPSVTGGTGTNTVTITVDDGTDPIAGVECWITTDAAGSNTIKSGTTNASGIVTGLPHLADGTYYLWLNVSGYDMTTSPETLTVAGTAGAYAETFSMTAATGGGATSTDYLEYAVDDVLDDIADKLGGSPTDAAQMRHLVAGYRTVLDGLDMRERPPRKHFWTFLEPAVTLNFWTTATGTMTVSGTGDTTITDSTNSPFYDSMVGATLVADTSENEYTISSVTSTSVVVVSADASGDTGDTFTITATGHYSTPAGYRGMKQKPVFTYSSDGTRYRLVETSPEHVRDLWRRDSSFGYTQCYAVEPLEFVATTGQKYRILAYPIPTEDMTATARIRLRVPTPETGDRFIGGDIVSIAIRDAALADVELIQGDTSGVWCAKADKSLLAAIDSDRSGTSSHSVERMESG